MMGIEPLQTQEPISWETEKKFHILRLVMFGAFYPNYFVKVTLVMELDPGVSPDNVFR